MGLAAGSSRGLEKMLDVVFALMIVSPVAVPSSWLPPVVSLATIQSLKRAAKALDLVGDNEPWLVYNFRFPDEITWCRLHRRNLRGTPPSWDALRFPPTEVADVFGPEAWEYLRYLEAMRWLDECNWAKYGPAIKAAEIRFKIWNTLRVTNHSSIWVQHKRMNLYKLRELLGEEYYNAGWVPPPVPPWSGP